MATIENLDPEYIPLSEEIEQVTQQEPEPLTGEFTSAGAAQKDLRSANYIKGEQGWKLNTNGIAEFTGLIIKDFLYTVGLNDNIQTAIDDLSSRGGGLIQLQAGTYTPTYNIEMKSNIRLVGAGLGSTIIDFNSTAYGIKMIGTESVPLVNCGLESFTVQNSTIDNIEVIYADHFTVKNIASTGSVIGIDIDGSKYFSVSDSQFNSNSSGGFVIRGARTGTTRRSEYYNVQNCRANNNGVYGFYASGTNVAGTYFGCSAEDNTSNGFYFNGSEGVNFYMSLIGCISSENGLHGFSLDMNTCSLIGCTALQNSSTGIYVVDADAEVTIIGCNIRANVTNSLEVNTANSVTFVGNITSQDSTASNNLMLDKTVMSGLNIGTSPIEEREVPLCINSSGGTLTAGSVVIMASDASGSYITTTTTQGDDKVFGMVTTSHANNSYEPILTKGKTALLKVNGTTDIAVGDLLGTYTSAGIAMKAAAGDMAFAIALEAYTGNDSNGVIDALLITPRKV